MERLFFLTATCKYGLRKKVLKWKSQKLKKENQLFISKRYTSSELRGGDEMSKRAEYVVL